MDSDDAQSQLIGSLRTQIQDLFSQVTQLNGKLVKSYDRVSDLEDDLHVASSNLRASSLKISQLELERTQHLSALNTGLLVEKSHVTAELTRLMEKATEEAAQRGQAESARMAIEKELDDLSASLFDQANTMVAEARYAQAVSEQKLVEAQGALKSAEDTVADMEKQVQTVKQEKECWERNKFWEKPNSRRIRFLASHTPYQEFLLFVAHLRSVHLSSVNPPAMSTLLPLPFLARLVTEDSDPTIRLDLAPSLNWLSRRSVMAAIHNNQLVIESVSTAYFYQEASNSAAAGNANGFNCALCGCPIFSGSGDSALSPTSSWSSTIFKRPTITSPTPSQTKLQTAPPPPPMLLGEHPHRIHVFRLSSPQTPTAISTLSSLTSPGSGSTSPPPPPTRNPQRHMSVSSTSSGLSTASVTTTTTYPLCTSGWCLERLKHTVDLWGFVRRDVVGRVWEEEVPVVIPPPPAPSVNGGDKHSPPPIPPRKRGLWGAFSERAQAAAAVWGSPEKKGPAATATPPPIPKRSEGRRGSAYKDVNGVREDVNGVKEVVNGVKEDVKEDVFSSPPEEKAKPTEEPNAEKRDSPSASPSGETAENEKRDSASVSPAAAAETTVPPSLSSKRDSVSVSPTAAAETTVPPSASSPTSIPLPPSRPSTPLTPGGAPTPPPRSRPVSMAGLAGGAPPPIPRRAAARGGAGVGVERAGSPVPVVGSKLREEGKEVEVKDVKEEIKDVKEESKEEDKVESKEEGKAEEVKREEEKPEAEEVAVKEEPEATAKEDVKTEAAKNGEETKEAELANPSPPLVNGHNDTSSPTESNSSTIPLVDGITPDGVNHEDTQSENGEADDRVWIGDATWEERTWKDLMKIKEEMFWARVGGFR